MRTDSGADAALVILLIVGLDAASGLKAVGTAILSPFATWATWPRVPGTSVYMFPYGGLEARPKTIGGLTSLAC